MSTCGGLIHCATMIMYIVVIINIPNLNIILYIKDIRKTSLPHLTQLPVFHSGLPDTS